MFLSFFCHYLVFHDVQMTSSPRSFISRQLIIATIPDGQGNSPSILTESNIKLLFDIQKKVSIMVLLFLKVIVCTSPLP